MLTFEKTQQIIDEWCLEWGLETSIEMENDLWLRLQKIQEKEE